METQIEITMYFYDWRQFVSSVLGHNGREYFVPNVTIQDGKFVFTLRKSDDQRVWLFKGPCTKENFDRIFNFAKYVCEIEAVLIECRNVLRAST